MCEDICDLLKKNIGNKIIINKQDQEILDKISIYLFGYPNIISQNKIKYLLNMCGYPYNNNTYDINTLNNKINSDNDSDNDSNNDSNE